MSERVTWKWVEEALFPLVVQSARKAGVDTTGWAFYNPGMGRALVVRDRDGLRVLRRFGKAQQAEEQLQAMRYAWSLVGEGA